MSLARSVTVNAATRAGCGPCRNLSFKPGMSKYPRRTITAAYPTYPYHNHNATQSTPQLGSLTTILSSSFISALRPPAKCASNILKTRHRIHIDPNHKIHFHAQTRPLRTSSCPRSPHQHIYRSARAKSPQHTPANGSSRPQEGHDIHLRPRNREAHSMHRFTT